MLIRHRSLPRAMALFLAIYLTSWMAQGLISPTPSCYRVTSKGVALHPTLVSTIRPCSRSSTRLYETEEQKKGFLDSILDPYPTKIPKEYREEINRAEGNTAAAQERTKRVTAYVVLAVVLVLIAIFNAFLTELRATIDPEVVSKFNEMVPKEEVITNKISLDDFGFGWAESNFLFRFFFISKIGGFGALISGAVLGLLVEAELDAKRANAEKIWEEIDRRKSGQPKKKSVSAERPKPKKKKKKRSTKGAKRMEALSEVLLEETPSVDAAASNLVQQETQPDEKKDGGIMGKFKEFYDKADSMAASQALLLNKELEDRGIVDKITDESGLKVIGREAAETLEEEKAKKEKKETD